MASATLSSVEEHEIAIRGDMIRLGQLLKLAGIVDSGGELHDFLAEDRRGRQLHPGDVVTLTDTVLTITSHPA